MISRKKIAMATCVVALTVALMSVFSFESKANVEEDEIAAAPAWCWGTLRYAQGIAVCDGASSNCTHPC
jgi:hypothetical protein